MYKENLRLPDLLLQDPMLGKLYNTQGLELDGLENNVSELSAQCFIDTATWGLDTWESFLGIPTDSTMDINYRRTAIKAKILGTGTVTASMLQSIAQDFSNGAVQISEYPSLYNFNIKFTGTIGIPTNISGLKAAIDQIKPAHLAVTYTYVYINWGQTQKYTWNQLKTKTWNDLMNGR